MFMVVGLENFQQPALLLERSRCCETFEQKHLDYLGSKS